MALFGGKKKKKSGAERESDPGDFETVLFQGAMTGDDPDLAAHGKLVQVGLPRVKQLVSDALARRAEKVRVDPKGERAQVSLFVDGVAFSGGRLSKQEAMAISQMAKLLAGLDIKQRGKPAKGGIRAEYNETKYEIFVETRPMKTGGEQLTLRLDNVLTRIETAQDAGFPTTLRDKIRDISSQKRGLMLVAGAPGTGVSTTALATLRSIDAYLFNIFNIADLGGREIVHVSNFEGEPGDDLEQVLARVIRKEAEVIFVDPITKAETAKVVLEAAGEACLVAEMPARGTAEAALQLAQWVEDPDLVAERLTAVINPKLIRRICKDCKEAYRPNPKLLQKVGLPPETTALYRQPKEIDPETGQATPVDCLTCGGLGYFGRTVMIEFLEVNTEVAQAIASGASPAEIRSIAKRAGGMTHRTEGVRLVAEGITSLEELQRVFRG